jgi:hypothetical protein
VEANTVLIVAGVLSVLAVVGVVVVAVRRDRHVKAKVEAPFIKFSFEAKDNHRNRQ